MLPCTAPFAATPFAHAVGYTKLRLWGLTQYKRVVYIDADALVMDNLDEVSRRLHAHAL